MSCITRTPNKFLLRMVLVSGCFIVFAAPSPAQRKFTPEEPDLTLPRIKETIDDNVLVRVAGTRLPILDRAVDQGKLDGNTKLGPLFLTLKSSPEQERALQVLLDQQQDKHSQNYHRWLTPDEFGAAFGVEHSDLEQISGWLTAHGFTVDQVAHGHRSITFSGTVAQVEDAFHTEIHNYLVNGERHFANNTDISIPEALSPVVMGASALNDFNPRPAHAPAELTTQRNEITPNPLLDATGGRHYVSPGDFSIIYNTQPLLQKDIDGRGVTIAIVGLSGDIAPNDPNIQVFRTLFLPSYNANNVTILSPPTCGAPYSKYPPAKPGALVCEPLKAARRGR